MFTILLGMLGVPPGIAKFLEPVIKVIAVIAALYGIYWYGGHVERVKHEAIMQKYIDDVAEARKNDNAAMEALVAGLMDTQTKLKADLATEKARKDKVKEVIKEVKTYVTEKADSICTITAGSIFLHDYPLREEDAGIPTTTPGNVDAPTNLKISELIALVSSNNNECVSRGKELKRWEDWYANAKAGWAEYIKSLSAPVAIPK